MTAWIGTTTHSGRPRRRHHGTNPTRRFHPPPPARRDPVPGRPGAHDPLRTGGRRPGVAHRRHAAGDRSPRRPADPGAEARLPGPRPGLPAHERRGPLQRVHPQVPGPRRGGGAARGQDGRPQGQHPARRRAHDQRLAAPAGLRSERRRHGGRTPARRRGRDRRQAQHGRLRHGRHQRDERVRHPQEPPRPHALGRRLLGRQRRRGRRRAKSTYRSAWTRAAARAFRDPGAAWSP